jgi:hypothetical protein
MFFILIALNFKYFMGSSPSTYYYIQKMDKFIINLIFINNYYNLILYNIFLSILIIIIIF